jgi:hypothetical protein
VDFARSELYFSSEHHCQIMILLQYFSCSVPDLSSLFTPICLISLPLEALHFASLPLEANFWNFHFSLPRPSSS